MPQTIQKLQARLQVALTVALFIPVIFQATNSVAGQTSGDGKEILQYGLVIAALIVDYVLLDALEQRILPYTIRIVGFLLYAELFSFVPVFYILAVLQDHPITSAIGAIAFGDGLIAAMVIPFIIAAVVLVQVMYVATDRTADYLWTWIRK